MAAWVGKKVGLGVGFSVGVPGRCVGGAVSPIVGERVEVGGDVEVGEGVDLPLDEAEVDDRVGEFDDDEEEVGLADGYFE